MANSHYFHVPVSDAVARQRVVVFLTHDGFRQISDIDGQLRFERGSIVETLVNFDPTRWACHVSVLVKPETNSVEIVVKMGISVDPFERRFAQELLTEELSRLEKAIVENQIINFDVSDLKKRISSHVFRIVGLFVSFFLPAVLGFIAGTLSYSKMNLPILPSSLTGAGVFITLTALCLLIWGRLKRHQTLISK